MAWPYFEMLVSTFIKNAHVAVDLPTALEWIRRVGCNPAEIDGNKRIYWLYECVRRAERQPPVAPDTFDGEIAHEHATNGSDVDFLKKKFRQTFWEVMGLVKKIAGERAGSDSSTVAPLPRNHFVRVSEARASGPHEECGDHRSHAAALRRPP